MTFNQISQLNPSCSFRCFISLSPMPRGRDLTPGLAPDRCGDHSSSFLIPTWIHLGSTARPCAPLSPPHFSSTEALASENGRWFACGLGNFIQTRTKQREQLGDPQNHLWRFSKGPLPSKTHAIRKRTDGRVTAGGAAPPVQYALAQGGRGSQAPPHTAFTTRCGNATQAAKWGLSPTCTDQLWAWPS